MARAAPPLSDQKRYVCALGHQLLDDFDRDGTPDGISPGLVSQAKNADLLASERPELPAQMPNYPPLVMVVAFQHC